MAKRFLLPLLFLLLLSGCGASAPVMMDTAPMGAAVESSVTKGNGMGSDQAGSETETEAPAECGATTQETESPSEAYSGNYFILSRGNHISTAEDGTELLYEYSCDVNFSSGDPLEDQWVDSLIGTIRDEYTSNSSNLLQYAQEEIAQNGKEYFYSYSNYQEAGIGRHDSKIVSLMMLSSIYSGGAHPNAVQTAWNLDLEQGILLKLEDVLCEGTAQELAEMVRQQVDEKFQSIGPDALFADYQESIQNAFLAETMTPYWYLNHVGLVIFFNQYELGPYAAGIIKLEIPYERLEGILREEYFPQYTNEIPGNLLLRGGWEGYRQIPLTVVPDGPRILIGVEGQVSQVQISEILWLEGTAIGQRMLFSADNLGQNDVIALTGGFDDPERSFAIEFQDGTGNTVLYYIHPEGLSTEP